ncbi:unnamed protein product, partial [Oikopleura dioica]
HESAITSRTLSSESALERLQNGLDKIEKPTTIELRRSPRKKSHESNKSASPAPSFPCKKCNFVSFPTFADLVEHMMLSHDPPADFPGFRKIERKNYDCPICKFPFPTAFKMKQHMDENDCFELPDDGHLASQSLSLKDNRGFHLCQMCDFKCKDSKVINEHIRDGHYPHRDSFVSSDPRLRQLGKEFRDAERESLNQPEPKPPASFQVPKSSVEKSSPKEVRKLRPARNLRTPQRFEGFQLQKKGKQIPLASLKTNLKKLNEITRR